MLRTVVPLLIWFQTLLVASVCQIGSLVLLGCYSNFSRQFSIHLVPFKIWRLVALFFQSTTSGRAITYSARLLCSRLMEIVGTAIGLFDSIALFGTNILHVYVHTLNKKRAALLQSSRLQC